MTGVKKNFLKLTLDKSHFITESRRSVRSYDASKTVTREQIKEIVEAGILAPSWKNSQTARYYCVIDEAAKEKFAKECLPEFNIKQLQGCRRICNYNICSEPFRI